MQYEWEGNRRVGMRGKARRVRRGSWRPGEGEDGLQGAEPVGGQRCVAGLGEVDAVGPVAAAGDAAGCGR